MTVFDCVMVYNELDMLELRMNILKDVVDTFVIVEAGETHSGQSKPAYFDEARKAGRFAEFEDQIAYSYVAHLEGAHSWDRERFNRGLLSGMLAYLAKSEDWVIVADCDEIPNPDAVRTLTERPVDRPVVFELALFYYDFNHRVHQGWGIGACKWGVEQDANKIRRCEFPDPPGVNTCKDGGWHLSYFLSPEGVVQKLNAFMHHADVAKDVPRDPEWIAARMNAGEDLFGRTVKIERVEANGNLPEYVQQHRAEYQTLGWLT